MPWSAMLHVEATGAPGLALRDKYAITTIPELVLLDGEAVVLCRNVHERLRDDPQGTYFPWQRTLAAPHIPQVDFDIVAHSRPDGASGGTPLRRPPGKPPRLGQSGPTQYRILGIGGRPACAVRLMIKGGARAPWLACRLACQSFPGWARK